MGTSDAPMEAYISIIQACIAEMLNSIFLMQAYIAMMIACFETMQAYIVAM